MKTITQSNVVARCQQRLTALTKYASGISAILINGVTFTPAQIAALYQASLDTRTKATSAKGVLDAAMSARKQADLARAAIDQPLKHWVANTFGPQSTAMIDFGYGKSKVQPSIEVKAQAVVKSRATRDARHTMGPRQKRKVKGVVPANPPVAKQ